MIKSLHAVNFRRHAELDLRFDDDRQLILIAGANGVGKSSILEAITFAFWGEGRHGRRNLDTLVRRGAELEGMSVDLTFTLADETYRIHRRRDGRSVTAVLYANDIPLVEGPLAVTAEISGLLGMDAAGFRLAVIAQQKDLDGLASLRPAERAQMVTRLLRLDVLTAARNAASTRFRSERDVAAALRGHDPDQFDLGLAEARAALASVEIEITQSRQAIRTCEEELLADDGVEARWAECARDVARLEGALAQLEARHLVLEQDLQELVLPEVTLDAVEMTNLPEELARVEREIAHAESATRNQRQRQVAAEELDRVLGRIGEVRDRVAELAAVDPTTAREHLERDRLLVEEVEARVSELRLVLGGLQGAASSLRDRLEETGDLGMECDLCGQSISEEHRATHRRRLTEELVAVEAEIESVKANGRELTEELAAARARETQTRAECDAVRAGAVEHQRLTEELVDLERRERIYTGQLERLDETPVDLAALEARRDELTGLLTRSAEHNRQVAERAAASTRRGELDAERDTVSATVEEHRRLIEAARPDAELSERHRRHQDAKVRRVEEQELLRHWETEEAVARTRIEHLEAQVRDARERDARRQQHQQRALYAAAASRLLGDVSERLATQIRPSLEGAVASLLTTMSEGRFTSVRISDEYTITVADDGKYRALGELSGGEIDLVALAVRLALAQVVSERHGSGGPGFLILDECFASQDSQRRQSILAALRNLRDVYSQIFLISHVENIEDAADMVVAVATDETRAETEVTVS